jgi:hypothetical protein
LKTTSVGEVGSDFVSSCVRLSARYVMMDCAE